MIAALQSSLSAKDMELEVNMTCILLKVYILSFYLNENRKHGRIHGPVHSTLEKFENAALFLRRLGLYRPCNLQGRRV